MKLLVINPNTSDAMTEDIKQTVARVKRNETEVAVLHPDFGPEALESFYDYQLASMGMIRMIKSRSMDYDGVLVACFGDPGLYALKEICDCPVIGIAEASFSAACLLGARFSVLAASEKAIPMMENLIAQYNFREKSAGVFSIGMSVLDAEKQKNKTIDCLIAAGEKAKQCGAEVLIPGCAGMTGLSAAVEEALGLVVVDPVGIGLSMLEMLVANGYRISKCGLYGKPAAKQIRREDYLSMPL